MNPVPNEYDCVELSGLLLQQMRRVDGSAPGSDSGLPGSARGVPGYDRGAPGSDDPIDAFAAIRRLGSADLAQALTTDQARKTFWINLYNALYQRLRYEMLRRDEHAPRKSIFTMPAIEMDDLVLSLDQIEHTLLRGHRHKYSLGYLPGFPPVATALRPLMIRKADYRIHFALNCGARSCPPIAFYRVESIESQLDLAAQSFIEQETEIDGRRRVLRVSRIYLWFLADFGGFRGVRRILGQTLGQPFDAYRIRFKAFDWTEELGKWG